MMLFDAETAPLRMQTYTEYSFHSHSQTRDVCGGKPVYFAVQGEMLKCHLSNESCRAVLSRGTVYYMVQTFLSLWTRS